MTLANKKFEQRARRAYRVRAHLKKISQDRPRLSVFRSGKHFYGQIIDDLEGKTLLSISTNDKELKSSIENGANINAAQNVGKELAKRASLKGIKLVKFDRGGYKYHGRIKAFADSARENGLEF